MCRTRAFGSGVSEVVRPRLGVKIEGFAPSTAMDWLPEFAPAHMEDAALPCIKN